MKLTTNLRYAHTAYKRMESAINATTLADGFITEIEESGQM
jgi:hypothetical protein